MYRDDKDAADALGAGGYVRLQLRSRVLMILGGIVAVVATAAFVALVRESSGDAA